MSDNKKIAWLDTVRVFASFAVILGHFVSCFDGFGGFDTGNVGVTSCASKCFLKKREVSTT